jgi:hypothetical protein
MQSNRLIASLSMALIGALAGFLYGIIMADRWKPEIDKKLYGITPIEAINAKEQCEASLPRNINCKPEIKFVVDTVEK